MFLHLNLCNIYPYVTMDRLIQLLLFLTFISKFFFCFFDLFCFIYLFTLKIIHYVIVWKNWNDVTKHFRMKLEQSNLTLQRANFWKYFPIFAGELYIYIYIYIYSKCFILKPKCCIIPIPAKMESIINFPTVYYNFTANVTNCPNSSNKSVKLVA